MNFWRKFLIPVILALFTTASCRLTEIKIPGEFIETTPPQVGSNEWLSLNNSFDEFGVSIADGKLDIKRVVELNRCELKIKGGTLVGINRGEFGGKLLFQPTDTTNMIVDVKDGNIKFLFTFQNKVYFIEGLAHMGFSSGALFELDITNRFTFTKLIDFEDAPEAFAIYKDRFLIATHENFYIVQNFEKHPVFRETFWNSLYPNSIVVFDDKNVFIGMRGGIAKVDLMDTTIKFYKHRE